MGVYLVSFLLPPLPRPSSLLPSPSCLVCFVGFVALGCAFHATHRLTVSSARVLPSLWLRSGCCGPCVLRFVDLQRAIPVPLIIELAHIHFPSSPSLASVHPQLFVQLFIFICAFGCCCLLFLDISLWYCLWTVAYLFQPEYLDTADVYRPQQVSRSIAILQKVLALQITSVQYGADCDYQETAGGVSYSITAFWKSERDTLVTLLSHMASCQNISYNSGSC